MRVAPQVSKRFVITGATGYLGPWLAREIVQQFGPDSLTCLIPKVLPPMEEKSLAYLRRLGVECLDCNLMECPVVKRRLQPIDVVIHMAANTRTDLREDELQVNTLGTMNLIETFRDSLAGKRVLLTSTSAAVDRDSRPRTPLTEESPTRPRTGYGRTKLKAEGILQEKAREYHFDYTILRLTTLYGPGMRGGLFYVLSDWVRRNKLFGRINWPGRASFTYVEDAAKIVLWFSSSKAASNQIFFVSSGETYTVGELAERMGGKTGEPAMLRLPGWFWKLVQNVIWLPGVNSLIPWRLGNVIDDSLLCDSSRMRNIYPGHLTTLDAGLHRTFESDSSEDEVARALA
jgi:nucleoside-diphosphate-sugar epimerase